LWVAGMAVITYIRVDQIVLRLLAGAVETGIYSAALRISEQGYLIPMTLAAPMLSALATFEVNSNQYAALVRRYFSVSVVAAYVFGVAIFVNASWIYEMLFGPEYHESARVLKIHVLSLPFVFLGVARTQVLIAEGMTRFAMWSTALGAIANFTLVLILAPKLGAAGAAWSSVAAQVVAAWLSSWIYAPARRIARDQTVALFFPWAAFVTRR